MGWVFEKADQGRIAERADILSVLFSFKKRGSSCKSRGLRRSIIRFGFICQLKRREIRWAPTSQWPLLWKTSPKRMQHVAQTQHSTNCDRGTAFPSFVACEYTWFGALQSVKKLPRCGTLAGAACCSVLEMFFSEQHNRSVAPRETPACSACCNVLKMFFSEQRNK